MSISSSIYIGTSGVIAQQESMSVISDNIANMSTVGFKSSRLLFNNLLSEQLTGASVGNQIGQGVGVSSVYQNMGTGPLETTTDTSDVAISGNGFFIVSPEGSTDTYYTKSGNFRFDSAGYYRDTHGNTVQGQRIAGATATANGATLEDIRLTTEDGGTFVSTAEATSELSTIVNLNSASSDSTTSTTSPFTALFDTWDAGQDTPLADSAYAYASSMKVYDSAGTAHTLTTYFDPVDTGMTDADGSKVWEYLVAMPASEDGSALDAKKGLLLAGTMTFNAAGELTDMTAFTGASDDKSTWVPAAFSEDGFPLVQGTSTGAATFAAALNFGLHDTSDAEGTFSWELPTGVATMADLDTSMNSLPGMGNATRDALASTAYATGSSTIYQSQNGYTQGALQSTYVDSDGVIMGKFSNGQEQGLYQIALADFINPQGLFREGGNLFSASKDSGAATTGWANEGRLGSILGSTLENSNVDLATEFVNMITTQKSFDANSKVITTADQVVQTALGVKK